VGTQISEITNRRSELSQASIHFQRRWYYALWLLLLCASLGLYWLWQTPLWSGHATVIVELVFDEQLEGCKVFTWVGPKNEYRKTGTTNVTYLVGPNIQFNGTNYRTTFRIPVSKRRWSRDYIWDSTYDLIVIGFSPAKGVPRFTSFSLTEDIYTGLLRPGRTMKLTAHSRWIDLKENIDLD